MRRTSSATRRRCRRSRHVRPSGDRHRSVSDVAVVQPKASEYPHNLFTILSETYALNVFEPYVRGCARSNAATAVASTRPAASAWRRSVEKLPLLYLQVVLPDDWARRLPVVNATHGGRSSRRTPTARRWRERAADPSLRPETGSSRSSSPAWSLCDRPALHFLHVGLLDETHRYPALRAGATAQPRTHPSARPRHRRFTARPHGPRSRRSNGHLLQIAFADAFLGRLREKLEAEGLYERALVIVTADHGVSFTPGLRNHTLDPSGRNAGDLLWVPLLVKLPGQTPAGSATATWNPSTCCPPFSTCWRRSHRSRSTGDR